MASRSFESVDIGEMSLEFIIASISTNAVVSSSKVSRAPARVLYKSPLADFTAASQSPPKWGALDGIKLIFIRFFKQNWEIEIWKQEFENDFFKSSNLLLAPTKLVAVTRFKAAMNASDYKSVTGSVCTALEFCLEF